DLHRVLRVIVEIYTASFEWAPFADPLPRGSMRRDRKPRISNTLAGDMMQTLVRIGPAVLLAVLAPVGAEFLLGDFTIRNLPVVLVLMPLYGCGALLIREIARRTGRGWPTILLLGTAYSFFEEGFLTQSLFNPSYVGQRLLDYGYLPALGTSLNWSAFVLSIHVVWSIATPILIAEGVAS